MQMTTYLSFRGQCEEAFKYYEATLGGRVGREDVWTARFGMVVDRFGIPWLINCDGAAGSRLPSAG